MEFTKRNTVLAKDSSEKHASAKRQNFTISTGYINRLRALEGLAGILVNFWTKAPKFGR
jgi:hypothetical protein